MRQKLPLPLYFTNRVFWGSKLFLMNIETDRQPLRATLRPKCVLENILKLLINKSSLSMLSTTHLIKTKPTVSKRTKNCPSQPTEL